MITLYVKTHNITGLKYFGKTVRKDPAKYKGSGKYWKLHLKKYGNNVTTEIIQQFDDWNECKKFALEFSNHYNIVKSDLWANLIEENGLDGAPKGVIRTSEHRQKISESRKGQRVANETKAKISAANTGKLHSDETRAKMSISQKGKIKGPRSDETKAKISVTLKRKTVLANTGAEARLRSPV